MAYNKNGLLLNSIPAAGLTKEFFYTTTTDSLATVEASGYFDPDSSDATDIGNLIAVKDFINVDASDGANIYWVSALSPITTVSIEGADPGELNLAQGNILVGNGSGKAAAFNSTGNAKLLLGNGTTMVSVSMSGDVNITNGGITTIANNAVTTAKLNDGAVAAGAKIALTEGSVFIGNASNQGAQLDIKGNAKLILGNGTTATSVSMSGDATITNAGVLTLANGSIIAGAKITLPEGNIFIGDVSNTGSNLDISASGQILVGNGTTASPVAVSNDATLASSGALTIANGVVTNAKLATNAVAAGTKIALTQGSIFIGDASNNGAELSGATSGAFFVGNGTTMTAVTMSGDATMTSGGVVTISGGAVSVGSLSLAEGSIIVGNAGGAGSALDAKTTGQLLIGNGTTITSVAMSGDATINAAGALTIAASAVETSMLADGAVVAGAKVGMTEGNVWIGNASNQADLIDISGDGRILVGNGTTATSVPVSGDITLANTGAVTIAAGAVDNAMLANGAITAGAKMALTRGSIWAGDAAGNGAELVAKTSGQILVGDGTDVVSVAVSGDATLASSGALTIAAGAVENSMLAAGAVAAGATMSLAEGRIFIGDASNQGSALAVGTTGQFLVSNGTTLSYVSMSGDATMNSAGVVTVSASAVGVGDITLGEGDMIIGNAGGVGSALDVSGNAKIIVGNGTTATSVSVSGDVTMDNAGAVTIANGAVEQAMIAPNTLDGTVAKNVASGNTAAGMELVYMVDTAANATANVDVVVDHKVRVIDVWTVLKGTGHAGDTIQVKNSATAISNALDINQADASLVRCVSIDDATWEIAAAGTLRVTVTDGGGANVPACTTFVKCVRVA